MLSFVDFKIFLIQYVVSNNEYLNMYNIRRNSPFLLTSNCNPNAYQINKNTHIDEFSNSAH